MSWFYAERKYLANFFRIQCHHIAKVTSLLSVPENLNTFRHFSNCDNPVWESAYHSYITVKTKDSADLKRGTRRSHWQEKNNNRRNSKMRVTGGNWHISAWVGRNRLCNHSFPAGSITCHYYTHTRNDSSFIKIQRFQRASCYIEQEIEKNKAKWIISKAQQTYKCPQVRRSRRKCYKSLLFAIIMT